MTENLNPFKYTPLLFTMSGKIGASPFCWIIKHRNPLNNPLQHKKSGLWLWYIFTIYHTVNTIFILITIHQHFLSYIHHGHFLELSVHSLYSAGYIVIVFVKCHQMFHKKDMVHPINQMIKLANQQVLGKLLSTFLNVTKGLLQLRPFSSWSS